LLSAAYLVEKESSIMVEECMDDTRQELLKRISVDPNICFGKPCIRGHRMWVSLILDMLASGTSFEEILENYPGIERKDIYACLAYGAEVSQMHYIDLEKGA